MRTLKIATLTCLLAACDPTAKEPTNDGGKPGSMPDAAAADAGADAGGDAGQDVKWFAWVESQAGAGEVLLAVPFVQGEPRKPITVVETDQNVSFSFVPAAGSLAYVVAPRSGTGTASAVKLEQGALGETTRLTETDAVGLGFRWSVSGTRIAIYGAIPASMRQWVDIYDLADLEATPDRIEPGTSVDTRNSSRGFSPTGKSFVFGVSRVGYATFSPLRVSELLEGRLVEDFGGWTGKGDDYLFSNGVTTFVQDLVQEGSEPVVLVDEKQGPFALLDGKAIAVAVDEPPSLALFDVNDLSRRVDVPAPFAAESLELVEWLGSERTLFVRAVQSDGVHAWLLGFDDGNQLASSSDLGLIANPTNRSISILDRGVMSADGQWYAYTDYAANPGLFLVNSETATQVRVSGETESVGDVWMTDDGRWLLYLVDAAASGGTASIQAVRLASNGPSQPTVIDIGAHQPSTIVLREHYAALMTDVGPYFVDLGPDTLGAAVPLREAPEEGVVVQPYSADWNF